MARTKKRVTKRPRSQVTRRQSVKMSPFTLPWKRLWLALVILTPLALIIGSYQWLQNPENLTIESVNVTGNLSILDEEQLEPVIAPFTKTNLYLLDAKGLETALENNPWVHSASMTKLWPDRLIIKIYEQKPVAYWGKDAMLAENGEIIPAVIQGANDKYPTLYSPREKGRNMATGFLKIRKWMQGFPLKMVEFKEDARGSWQIRLENGLMLKIGRNEQQKRLKRFMVGYKQSLIEVIDKIKTVDLRYTNGFAVQWKKGLSADSVFKELKG